MLTAQGSRDLPDEPALASFKAQMSPADFEVLLWMIRDVRNHYQPIAAQDRFTFDTTLYQIASPHDRARYIAGKREMARIAAKSPIAQDAASAEASFLRMFPGASIPPRCHY